jgi:hypothetical protein
MHHFLKFILGMKFYMFLTVPLAIIRSFSLYTQQWYMSYRYADSLQAGSGWNCSSILILLASCQHICMTYIIAVFTVKKTLHNGQRNCPKHVEFYSKNKFEKSVNLVDFIIRNLTRCTVTWTSNEFGIVTNVTCTIGLQKKIIHYDVIKQEQ